MERARASGPLRELNVEWQDFDVTREAREALKLQRAQCLWLTGLPASGKSTIANLLERRLTAEGRHTYLLDGDNLRHGLNRDLGFAERTGRRTSGAWPR